MLLDASLLGAAYRNRTDDMGLVSGAVSLSVSGAGHNPAMKLRRLRDGDVLENGEVVLVRGGDLAPDILSADAVRYYSIYGTYGISVFAVRDATVDELAQQVPLIRFGSLALLKAGDVLAAGMRLEPTGRNPRHYTVGFDVLEDGVRRLASCPHQVVPNAYHDA
jgi:hypothetical protein